MNPVEIEEAVTGLALQPFHDAEFPFAPLEAFGKTFGRRSYRTCNELG